MRFSMPMKTISRAYVEQTRVRRQSRGWKCLCPVCGGNDCWYTPDNHIAFCFNCGETFRVIDHTFVGSQPRYVVPLDDIRMYYATVTDWYRTALDTHVEAMTYLQSRGIDRLTASTYRLGYCPPIYHDVYAHPVAHASGIVTKTYQPTLAQRIIFPYIANGQITDLRGRSIAPAVEPKYRSLPYRAVERGAIFAFNYDRAVERLQEAPYLLITEGEIKALFADMAGFAVVAFPGMQSYRVIPATKKPKIIIFDSDAHHQQVVDRAIIRTAQYIGMEQVFVVRLPLFGESKMDIDTFLRHPQGGHEYFTYLVTHALPIDRYLRLRSV